MVVTNYQRMAICCVDLATPAHPRSLLVRSYMTNGPSLVLLLALGSLHVGFQPISSILSLYLFMASYFTPTQPVMYYLLQLLYYM